MKFCTNKSLYAVRNGDSYLGVYSSLDDVRANGFEDYEEIIPDLLEGSPCSDGYVCFVAGTQTMLVRKNDGFDVECYNVGPVWGSNIQSAVARAIEHGYRYKNTASSVLRIYQIGKDYSMKEPENLADFFAGVTAALVEEKEPSEEVLTTDYIGLYFERKEKDDEYRAIYASKRRYADLIADKIMRDAYAGYLIRCSNVLVRQKERIVKGLCHLFSLDELKVVSVLLDLQDDTEVAERIENGMVSEENIKELSKKLKKCFPARIGARERNANTEANPKD